MLHLILGKDWTANRNEILRRISEDVRNKFSGRILIVPELISHEMERALCYAAGDTASRYAEVLSFSRMARRSCEATGSAAQECLDNGGRVVAMAAAARQLAGSLKAYASLETKPEFLTELIDAIDEFKRCCISPADLKQAAICLEGSLAQKIEELSLLMEGYDAICSRGKRDPRDQMTAFLEQLEESSYGAEHVFYIDGFPDFTRQNFAVIEHLLTQSEHVTVSLNCDRAGSTLLAFEKAGATAGQLLRSAKRLGVEVDIAVIPQRTDALQAVRDNLFQGSFSPFASKALSVHRAGSLWDEAMGAALHIQELVQNGCRYRDISLVSSDMSSYLPVVQLILHRMHIPLYQSGTEEILQKTVIATVLTGLEAALTDFDQKNVMRYFRSSLSGMNQDMCDELENYTFIWGIHGSRWMSTWENHPDGLIGEWDEKSRKKLALLNEVRQSAIAPLEKMRRGFQKAENLSQQVSALYAFLEDIHLAERLSQLADQWDDSGNNREAQILNQLWEILLSALEQMYDVLGDTRWETEHFSRLLRLLLSQYDVGTIPPVLDAVQMGPVNAMRCHESKHLILLGALEGNLPGYSGSAGVLTDQERVALRQLGVPLTGGAMEGIQEEFAEIYGVFCGASESIWISCPDGQPSFIYRRLLDLAGKEESISAELSFAASDPYEAGAALVPSEQEASARRLGVIDSYLEVRNKAAYHIGTVSSDNIHALYGKSLNLSASQIDKQAECRMSYFLNYGLRARERKEAAVDPAEFGTYVHAVLENTARCVRDMGGFQNVSLQETLEIAHRYSEEYAHERFRQIESERIVYLFRRNLRELDMVVEELWEELQESSFSPVDFEVAFGNDNGLPAIAIPNSKINAILRGFVDRVDVWQTSGCSYYRVVDYKTGKKDFDYCDVFNGVGLQMLLYLFALKDSGYTQLGEHPIAAGVQYFPARVPYLNADGVEDVSKTQKDRLKEWKRKGLLLKDMEVLHAMEPSDTPQRMGFIVKNDEIKGDVADRNQLALLEKYTFRILGKLVEDIASGNVEPNPYTRGNAHDACRFCPYGNICHKESITDRRNYKMMNAERFWEEVGKEMSSYGK